MAETHALSLDRTTAVSDFDPLWVPLLTHYGRGRPGEIDPARTCVSS